MLVSVEFDDYPVVLWVHCLSDGVTVAVLVNESAVTRFFTADDDGIAGDVTTVAAFRI